jgi:hypothetical protein
VFLPPPKNVPAADVFRALLAPEPIWPIDWKIPGEDATLFVRPLGSYDWIRLHRAVVTAEPARRADAENALIAACVVDEGGESVFSSADDVAALYAPESAGLADAASRGLATISPTLGAADVEAWLVYLREGAFAPENFADTISLGQCSTVSFGFGRGAVVVRHEPELYYGIPRRRLVDAQWLAYYAAARVHAEATRK